MEVSSHLLSASAAGEVSLLIAMMDNYLSQGLCMYESSQSKLQSVLCWQLIVLHCIPTITQSCVSSAGMMMIPVFRLLGHMNLFVPAVSGA